MGTVSAIALDLPATTTTITTSAKTTTESTQITQRQRSTTTTTTTTLAAVPSSVSGTEVDKPAITTPLSRRPNVLSMATAMTTTTETTRSKRKTRKRKRRRKSKRRTITVPRLAGASRRIVPGRCGTGKHSWESEVYIFNKETRKYVDMCENPVKHIPTDPLKICTSGVFCLDVYIEREMNQLPKLKKLTHLHNKTKKHRDTLICCQQHALR